MQNQNPGMRYQPINCWKCNTQNNIASTQICRHCGSYLKSAESANIHSFSLSDILYIKWLIGFFVFGVLFIVVVSYSQTKSGGNYLIDPNMSAAENEVNKDVEIPAASWYNQSYWSYVSSGPSIQQILEKNKEVSGKEIYPDTVDTYQLSGTISGFKMKLQGDMCYGLSEDDLKKSGDKRFEGILQTSSGCKDYFQNEYQDLGSMRIIMKKPDMVLKITNSKNAERTDQIIYEGFNKNTAWRKTQVSTGGYGSYNTKIEDLSSEELLKAQNQINSTIRESNEKYSDAEYIGLRKVNKRVAFTIKKTANGVERTFYFDAVTGFIIKVDMPEMSMFMEEYKDFNGTQFPSVFYYRFSEKKDEYLWLKVENLNWTFDEYFDDSIFLKPAK